MAYVLVVGAMLLDVKGKPRAGLEPGTSNPAFIRSTRGGSARNVAENLARLGAEVMLVSAVGDDETGQHLVASTASAGIEMSYVHRVAGQRSGSYMAVLDPDGTLAVALDDVSVIESISPNYLYQNRRLFRDAEMLMVDGSLTEPALEMAVRLAQQYDVPICADPSSTRVAYKYIPHVPALRLAVPNESEAAVLCQVEFEGHDSDRSQDLARQLVRKGVRTAVITLANYGLVYAAADETGYIPARYTEVVDGTGTGDAVTAAIMFGMLNDLPVIESIRLGAAAASLTVQTSQTVVADLSLDMLYDHLVA